MDSYDELSTLAYNASMDVNINNTSVNVSHYVFEDFERIFFILDVVIMLASFVCNIGVIYFICGQKRARTTHNITIVSIAVADIFVASFVMPSSMAISSYDSVSAEVAMFLCKLSKYFWHWCKTVSVYSILAMVIDRYFKVTQPYKTSAMAGRCMFFLNFVWFFGASYNIWQLVLNTSLLVTVPMGNETLTIVRRCVVSSTYDQAQAVFMYGDFVMIFLLPFVIMLCLYVSMLSHVCQNGDPRNSVSGRRRLLMSLFLFSLFFCCQLPLEVQEAVTLHSYSDPEVRSGRSLSLFKMLETVAFMQGFLNITAYASCSAELHRRLWKGGHRGEPGEQVVTATGQRTGQFSIVATTSSGACAPTVLLTAANGGGGTTAVCIEPV